VRQGKRQQIHQVETQGALDLDLVALDHAPQRQVGIAQAAGLRAIRLPQAQRRQCGLQARVVQQCDLHRRVGVQRRLQQSVHRGAGRGIRLGRDANRHALHTGLAERLDFGHAGVGRHTGASPQQADAARQQQHAQRGHQCFPSCRDSQRRMSMCPRGNSPTA
jgi:hypothetical protein